MVRAVVAGEAAMNISTSVRMILVGSFCLAVGATLGPTIVTAASSTKDVLVINTEAEAVPVALVGEEPPQVTPVSKPLQFAFTDGGFSSFSIDRYEVPAGQLLEINFVTFYDLGRTQAVTGYEVHVQHDGESITHRIASVQLPGDGDMVTAMTKIYADPGSDVSFIVNVAPDLVPPPGVTSLMHGSFVGTLTDV
jgi:hypothetical protein